MASTGLEEIKVDKLPDGVAEERAKKGYEMVGHCLNGHCATSYIFQRGHALTTCVKCLGPMLVERASEMRARNK